MGVEKLHEFISSILKMSENKFDFLSNEHILLLCVNGKSNKTISEFLDIEVEYVVETIQNILGFGGFEKDLDFSPIMWYNYLKLEDERLYGICKHFVELSKEAWSGD